MHGTFSPTPAAARQQRCNLNSLPANRLAEINRLFRKRYGDPLRDRHVYLEERAELRFALNQLAQRPYPERHMRAFAATWTPWMPADELNVLIARILRRPRRYTAATAGSLLQLTDAERTALKITTIRAFDITPEERAERKREQARVRQARRRQRLRETIPKAPPASQTKPWEAAGVSRATWYRRQRETVRQKTSRSVSRDRSVTSIVSQALPPGPSPQRGPAMGSVQMFPCLKPTPLSTTLTPPDLAHVAAVMVCGEHGAKRSAACRHQLRGIASGGGA